MPETQDHLDESTQAHENIDQWACPICMKNMSPSHPPTFNVDNCSCAGAASYTNGNGSSLPQALMYDEPVYAYDTTSHMFYQKPESCSSSSPTVSIQEGPEREYQDLHINNSYLPLGPAAGLNKDEHTRSASFHFNLSYQMQRFLVEPDYDQPPPYSTEHSKYSTETRLLSQDPYIQYQSSRSGKKSNNSKPSMQSSGSGDGSWIGWGVDPVKAAGAWMDESGNRYTEGVYPMAMSGLTEFVFEER